MNTVKIKKKCSLTIAGDIFRFISLFESKAILVLICDH